MRERLDRGRPGVCEHRGRGWLALVALFAHIACAPQCPPQPPSPKTPAASEQAREWTDSESFELERGNLERAGASPELLASVDASPFQYFRLLAGAYEVRVCHAFHAQRAILPIVAVHGDPHLEQFVVTGKSYGLEDFDRSGFGPSVVDIVRYVASLHVACAATAFDCDAGAAAERFFSAYRAALSAPAPDGSVPEIVANLRAKVPKDRRAWLAWADSRMEALDDATERHAISRWQAFVGTMAGIRPDLKAESLRIVKVGGLTMGIGSALERKMLFRVAGPTDSPDDDLLIEAREGRPPSVRGCVWRPNYGESLILMFAAVLGRRLPNIHGFAPLVEGSQRFFVQDWDAGYAELSVRDIETQSALEELATDAGHQLGGHLWSRFPPGLLAYQLHAQRAAFDATRTRASSLGRELALETVAAWQRFRGEN